MANILLENHTSTVELAEIAEQIQPKQLVLYHIMPSDAENDILNEISEHYSGKVILGDDLDVF